MELWFAFIFLSLSYWQQLREIPLAEDHSCDLLSFSYLCRTDNNLQPPGVPDLHVVICFHFPIFVVLTTTPLRGESLDTSCDLLSFSYLCRTDNNIPIDYDYVRIVVICFHFPIFVVLTTTILQILRRDIMLWFAFIFLSLSYWQQLFSVSNKHHLVVICFHFPIFVVLTTTARNCQKTNWSCDLLSFSYLCRTDNNILMKWFLGWIVVICFHFPIFVVLTTTGLTLKNE